jgi:hypothetical protein
MGDSGGVVEHVRSALHADSFIAASLSAATAPSPRAAPAGTQMLELKRGLPPDDAVRATPAGHAHAAPHPPRIAVMVTEREARVGRDACRSAWSACGEEGVLRRRADLDPRRPPPDPALWPSASWCASCTQVKPASAYRPANRRPHSGAPFRHSLDRATDALVEQTTKPQTQLADGMPWRRPRTDLPGATQAQRLGHQMAPERTMPAGACLPARSGRC